MSDWATFWERSGDRAACPWCEWARDSPAISRAARRAAGLVSTLLHVRREHDCSGADLADAIRAQ